MKYFNPSYWFKLSVLSAPLFNDKTQGINAKSIDNKKIKDWASNNTILESINQEISYTNSITNYQPYNLNETNQNIDPIYQPYLDSFLSQQLETSTHKNRHEKSRNRHKRQSRNNNRSLTTPIINLIAVDQDGIYFRELLNVIEFLRDNDILREIAPWIINVGYSRSSNNPIYYINENSNYQNFIIPINIVNTNEQQDYGQRIQLVFRTNNLYLQGFIVNNTYYYFSDSDTRSVNVDDVNNNYQLSFNSNYNSMIQGENPTVNWQNIFDAFNNIINYHQIRTAPTPNPQTIRTAIQRLRLSLPFVILATSESIRFKNVREDILSTNRHLDVNNQDLINTIRENINSNNQNHFDHITSFTWNHFSPTINNWEASTSSAIDQLREEGSLSTYYTRLLTVLQGILIDRFVNECFNKRNFNKREISKKLYCLKKISYELEIYWNGDRSNEIIHFAPTNSVIRQQKIYTVNLGKRNPIDNFNRFNFLGDTFSDNWGVKIKWGSWIYDGQHQNRLPENTYSLDYYMQNRNYKFHDIIKNQIVYDNISREEFETHTNILLQSISEHDFLAWVEGRQKIGLTWYWENENYYLQFLVFQYLNWKSSYADLDCWLKIGSGIRLYNDNSDRSKRSVFDNNSNNNEKFTKKLEEKNELKNVTKWNDEFTKSINNEQHLPIDNKTNFSTSNITSL
ncbi:ribosome-inactivating family protein [Spiroplasma endosymbiont of Melieria omissa]|uniref:ribosome-inactivating family protein n=1 Tax=Spiroplasma endosymbiont of Melieria omissa TaxID=3139324 RepID=UPI003CCB0B95